jgi:class 3 adenylate cyclase/tetratricopeptide (TPR) repeat protein
VVPVCPNCGREAPEDARFCAGCGTALAFAEPARQERKIVTVLFADLVGSTARAELLDPEDVSALLAPFYARLRSELERCGGTVEKFIGDAVMAVFGAPATHEDDPERAVRAALAIRDWALDEQDLEVRIAVHTGEAFVALGARPAEGEGMVAGDVVNTAARLQAAAPVNGILVGEATYRATAAAIEYQPYEPVQAKGKLEPVPVWCAVRARARLGVDVGRTHTAPLVGRAPELAVLTDVVERVLHEQAAQLLTVCGAPGIGKSRLVFELMQVVNERPELIIWRQGRSLPYGEGLSFWSLAEIVKAQAGILDGAPPEETETKLRRAAETAAGEEAEWVLRHLRVLVGVADDTGARVNQVERFAAWRRFMEGIAERSPTVLVFEDLHWADDGLLDFVDYLVEWAAGVPLLVLGTARPELFERRPAWGGGKRNATTVSLAPLSDDETGRLVVALLDRPLLPAEDHSALVERAGGNPLYAEQYARMLTERGAVAGAPPPETVQGVIAGRLDRLPPEHKRLLQDASVIGKVFWSAALAGPDGRDLAQLEAALHELERKELVQRARRSSVAGSEEYAFSHVLVRDVAYGQIPRATRSERHRATARWLETLGRGEEHAEVLAHHYVTALELARAAGAGTGELEESARRALAAAADRAWTLNAFGATVEFAGKALELTAEGSDERPHLLLRLGRGRRYVDETGAEELEAARSGLLALGDRAAAAEASVYLADLAVLAGDGSAMERHAADAESLVEGLPPSAAKALVLGALARFQMLGTEYASAVRLADETLALTEPLELDAVRASALNTRGVARVHLDDPGGVRDVEDSLELAQSIHSVFEVLRGYTNLAHVMRVEGDARRAHELNLENLRTTELLGAGGLARWARANLASGHYEQGEWDEALRIADEFIADVEAGAQHAQEDTCRVVRAEIRLGRGDIDGAAADLEAAIDIARRRKGESLGEVQSTLARMLLEAGRLEEAGAALDELLALADADPAALESFEVAWVASGLGRADDVRVRLERLPARGRWAEATLAFVRGDFATAADHYAAGRLPVYEARSRLAAVEALAADGRRAEAEAQLASALAFFRSAGATRYVRDGEAYLAATA